MIRFRALAVAALAVAAALTVSVAAVQQTADEIILKNIEAKGGLERIKAVHTIKKTSTISMTGTEAKIVVYGKRPDLVRQEVDINGQLVVNGFDGKTAWILNPFVGPKPPRPVVLSGAQAEQIKLDSSFDGPLVDYRSQGFSAKLEPANPAESPDLLHLVLTAANGRAIHVYLDPKTYLDVKHTMTVPGATLEQQFGDYRTVDGQVVPFTIRMLVNGVPQNEIKLQQVEFNTPMDDALFRLPK